MKEELKNELVGMSVEELQTLKAEQESNEKISRDDKEKRIEVIDSFIKKGGGSVKVKKEVVEEPKEEVVDERLAEKIEKGWTPLEAQELLDIEDGKIKPEDAELISYSDSDGNKSKISDAYTKGDKENMTEKQKENHSYLYSRAVKELKEKRKELGATDE